MKGLLYMLADSATNSEAAGLKGAAEDLWNNTVWPIISTAIWILVAVLAVVFIVKAVLTAMAVMKAADDPQARQEKLQGFKFLAIGLGVAIVVLTLANTIMGLVMKEANVEAPTSSGNTFLF